MNPFFFAVIGSFIGSSVSNVVMNYMSEYEERKHAKDVIRKAEALLKDYYEYYDSENH